MRTLTTIAAILVLCTLLLFGSSCSSSDKQAGTTRSGTLSCTVSWPIPKNGSRIIPDETTQIKVMVYKNRLQVATAQTIDRIPGVPTANCKFFGLPEGDVRVTVWAMDARGNLLADDTATATIIPADNTPLSMALVPLSGSIAYTENFESCKMWSIVTQGAVDRRALGLGLFPRYSGDGAKMVFGNRTWREPDPNVIGNIFIMNADGTDQQQVTHFTIDQGVHAMYPSINHDGTKIAFMLIQPYGVEDLCTINPDGSGFRNLTNHHNWGESSTGPYFAPDGRIVYAFRTNDWDYEVHIMNDDGTGDQFLADTPGLDIDVNVSADGSKITFCSFTVNPNDCEVFTMNIDGSNLKQLTNDSYLNMCPVFSPDGRKIAYAACQIYDAVSNGPICIINADGTSDVPFTIPNTINGWPNSWGLTAL